MTRRKVHGDKRSQAGELWVGIANKGGGAIDDPTFWDIDEGSPEDVGRKAASVGAQKGYSDKMSEVYGLLHLLRDASFQNSVRRDWERVVHQVVTIPHEVFAPMWIVARTLISLQARLYVEQVLFSLGKPWSDLIAGFKPAEGPYFGPTTVVGEKKATDGGELSYGEP